MKTTMKKRLEFDAGHRLMHHESKCRNLHGHRYVVEVTIELEAEAALDLAGRIVDFSDVKALLGEWIDDTLDHACIVNAADKALVDYLGAEALKHFVVGFEPSAENLAAFILERAAHLLDVPGARHVSGVVLFETPTSSAEVRA